MKVVPLELKEANALVESIHRHHKKVQGHRFSVGAEHDGVLVGAAIVGRPVHRGYNQKEVLEVTRLVTDGTKNACSFLYSAAARIGKEMGYKRIQTYILEDEPGTSLRAAGWEKLNWSPPVPWTSRPGRDEQYLMKGKVRYSKDLQ